MLLDIARLTAHRQYVEGDVVSCQRKLLNPCTMYTAHPCTCSG